MLYFIFTTGRCNLNCKYCGGSFPEEIVQSKVRYDINLLKSFLKGDKDVNIAFYGGEPLLEPETIMNIMNRIQAKRFMIQTNGLLVDSLKPKYWRMMDTILLSIDGVESLTDKYRGRGVYRKVLEAAKKIRKMGFKGDMIARMTVTRDTDIFRDVTHLLATGLFDHIHWQLNVIWSERWNFKDWSYKSYLPGLAKLLDFWIDGLKRGEVYGIVPFQGVIKRSLKGGEAPPCEAGVSSYALKPDGTVIACPIAVDVNWSVMGDVRGSWQSLKMVRIGEPCTSCSYFRICGGRCLYAYMERDWGIEGFNEVCDVTKKFIDMVLSRIIDVKRLADAGIVSMDEILYPKYNNTTEIIP